MLAESNMPAIDMACECVLVRRPCFFFSLFKKSSLSPNLSSTHISVSRCPPVLIPFYFSSNLTRIDFDLGFKASPPSTDDQLCAYFTRVADSCRGLQHLSLRGHASERLNDIISRLSDLHSISLKLGTTLSPKTLKAIMDFPRLSELEVHAGHIEFYDVNDKREDYSIFTSLRKLHIRAQSTLIQDILQHIPSNTLRYIHLELDDLSSCTTFWNACFSAIADKNGETLQHPRTRTSLRNRRTALVDTSRRSTTLKRVYYRDHCCHRFHSSLTYDFPSCRNFTRSQASSLFLLRHNPSTVVHRQGHREDGNMVATTSTL